MSREISREQRKKEIEKELEELEKTPLKHPKPQLHTHPFLDVVFGPGITGFPITDPNPSFTNLVRSMRWTDWAYVGGATGFLIWKFVPGTARPFRNAIFCTSLAAPFFLSLIHI